MGRNQIQFQSGYGLLEFERNFPDEATCRQDLERRKWPKGYHCRECGGSQARCFARGPDDLPHWECHACGDRESLYVGTLFEHTRLPLRTWYLAILLFSQSKTQLSALELHRQLGVNDKTALLLKHKLMSGATAAEESRKLEGRVELDDAYLGGARHGQGAGRGSANKVPILAAVETDAKHHPKLVVLSRVEAFTLTVLSTWTQAHLAPNTVVHTDGLSCFHALEASCDHHAHNMSIEGKAVADTEFKWVNTLLGNIKSAFNGVLHGFDHFRYAPRYLGFLQFLFNHRFDLKKCFFDIIDMASHSIPRPQPVLSRTLSG